MRYRHLFECKSHKTDKEQKSIKDRSESVDHRVIFPFERGRKQRDIQL